MVLRVSSDEFISVAKRLGVTEVFESARTNGVRLTASISEGKNVLVADYEHSDTTVAADPKDDLKASLEANDMVLFQGTWLEAEPALAVPDPQHFVAAVSYLAAEDSPGVWVDAYVEMPSPVQVLRHLYDEFKSTGELGEFTFDEFVSKSRANVIICSPSELTEYAARKLVENLQK